MDFETDDFDHDVNDDAPLAETSFINPPDATGGAIEGVNTASNPISSANNLLGAADQPNLDELIRQKPSKTQNSDYKRILAAYVL